MLSSLDAGNNYVMNVLDPQANQDATTKNYVDNSLLSYTPTLTALFPVLTSNTTVLSSGAWIASASSEYSSTFAAYKVTTNNDWATLLQTTNY